jgi:predicted PhzF superfamily epimerase YddE/YHI9
LTAERKGEWIEMDFPATPAGPAEPPPGLLETLGVKPVYVGRTRFDYLIEVESEARLRAVQPDFQALGKVEARGIIVTSRADTLPYHFVSRFFAPASGINEDPVTGSAHCCLAPHWQERLGKAEMVGYQASPRGGVVRVRVAGPRVFLGGNAVTVLRGELV